jgi:hypothetical protein
MLNAATPISCKRSAINIDRIIIPTQTVSPRQMGAINNGFGQPNHQVNIFKTPAPAPQTTFFTGQPN